MLMLGNLLVGAAQTTLVDNTEISEQDGLQLIRPCNMKNIQSYDIEDRRDVTGTFV